MKKMKERALAQVTTITADSGGSTRLRSSAPARGAFGAPVRPATRIGCGREAFTGVPQPSAKPSDLQRFYSLTTHVPGSPDPRPPD